MSVFIRKWYFLLDNDIFLSDKNPFKKTDPVQL